jgi:TRAP-type C4-dicarboxylate transport system permease small subunit
MSINRSKDLVKPDPPGFLSQLVRGLSKIVDPVTSFGAVVACTALAAMMFLTFFDVAGSQLGKISWINHLTTFFKPIIGSQEITQLLMLLLVSFALGYTALKKGHIRVDIVMQYTSKKTNHWFDICANFFSFVMYVFIAWQGCVYAFDNIRTGTVSIILNIPIPPFNFLLVLGAALAALIFLRDFLKSIEEVNR